MSINFSMPVLAIPTISAIADRAVELADRFDRPRQKMHFVMDIAAANNSCPLDLDRLLAADDSNFAHDVFGIANHLDRQTGELTDCFLPRFAIN